MNVEKIKTMLQQNYQDIIDDGEVEQGTEEWLCLLEVALNVNDVILDDMYDLITSSEDEMYIKYPKLKELNNNGYIHVSELEKALEELGVEVY
jgi:hypothetical protein